MSAVTGHCAAGRRSVVVGAGQEVAARADELALALDHPRAAVRAREHDRRPGRSRSWAVRRAPHRQASQSWAARARRYVSSLSGWRASKPVLTSCHQAMSSSPRRQHSQMGRPLASAGKVDQPGRDVAQGDAPVVDLLDGRLHPPDYLADLVLELARAARRVRRCRSSRDRARGCAGARRRDRDRRVAARAWAAALHDSRSPRRSRSSAPPRHFRTSLPWRERQPIGPDRHLLIRDRVSHRGS